MNRATIRSLMRWMPINVRQNLIRPMFTSKRDFNCSAVDRRMGCQCRPALHFLRMFILKRIKLLGQLDLQDLNGATLLPNLLHLDLMLDHQQMAGEVDLLRLILLHTPPIRMTSGNRLAVLVRSHLHHVLLAQGKSSK